MIKCCVLVAVVAMASYASADPAKSKPKAAASPWDDTYEVTDATGGGYAACPDSRHLKLVVSGGKFELPLTYQGDNIGTLKGTVLDSGKTKVDAVYVAAKPGGMDENVYNDARSQVYEVTFQKLSGGRIVSFDAGGDRCQLGLENDSVQHTRSPSSSSSSSNAGKKSGSKSRGKSCVASGGWTSNAGNCCSNRYAHGGKATDAQNQCK